MKSGLSVLTLRCQFDILVVAFQVVLEVQSGKHRMKRFLAVLRWVCLAGSSIISGCVGKSSQVTAIAMHPETPETLYIATNDNVYKTRDGGLTWAPITEGMGHARILSLAIHPLHTAMVYAGTLGDAVYRSVDGGALGISRCWPMRSRSFLSPFTSRRMAGVSWCLRAIWLNVSPFLTVC